ncbi:sulfate transporter family protein [Ochrobactrum quorumnocens]|jgi:CysZ protein|uniref:Etoposide-induced 2.4 family protein n=1 Tax=Ochrobactrum quorumnocens TaxID=271865 RepID=A0A248UH51_9HYPH|nr:sulfate transporter family protein [[Ochrobactrum] quorumnocens]ASV86055.1 etoposide-induced 2.4 family protein [[Ochrobactrum] quorumnocens]KAA9366802.1 sulfate transporter family protein [[Ochrobactrum] quorumnocens]MBD7992294.1 sulfate transporter family protein [Ochrobactrum gallinarum]
MIIDAALKALKRLPTPEFRSVLWKTLGLTLLLLVGLWVAIRQIFFTFAWPWMEQLLPGIPGWAGWLGIAAAIVAGLGLALVLALMIAPVTALVAGIFLDDIADVVEREDYPREPAGTPLPLGRSVVVSLKFLSVVILGNIVALVLLFVPGINLIAFFVINAYLLGREFFEFAAMRYRSESEAKALRSQYGVTVFLAGLLIAAFMAIPLVNLLTPLFAAAMMIHLHKAITQRETLKLRR